MEEVKNIVPKYTAAYVKKMIRLLRMRDIYPGEAGCWLNLYIMKSIFSRSKRLEYKEYENPEELGCSSKPRDSFPKLDSESSSSQSPC